MADAKLYEVRTVRGTVYALLDVASGMIWTERSEQAARQLAQDRRLSITDEVAISHEELLRLMGHEPLKKSPMTGTTAGLESSSEAPAEDGKSKKAGSPFVDTPMPKLSFPVRYYLDDEESLASDDANGIVPQPARGPNSVFFSDGEITSKAAPAVPDEDSDRPDPPLDHPAKI